MAGAIGATEDLVVGAARSKQEIRSWLTYEARCRYCQKVGVLVQSITPTPERDDIAARVTASCTGCGKLNRYAFVAGPGWENPPAEDGPRLASGEAPSQVLPAPLFVRWIREAAQRLKSSNPNDRVYRTHQSQKGLRAVDELRRLRRAAGDELSADEKNDAREFAEAWIALGLALPDELSWTRSPC